MGLADRSKGSLGNRPGVTVSRTQQSTKTADDNDLHKVGDCYADYGSIPVDEIATPIPEVDALLERSRVVSEKRGL